MDPGPPPLLDPGPDDDFKTAAVEVIDKSGQLDPGAGDTIDISPGALGPTRSERTTVRVTRRTP